MTSFVHIAQIDRPIMVPIAGFSKKSSTSTFYLQFVHISNFFQFFPKLCAPDRDTGAAPYAICSCVKWRHINTFIARLCQSPAVDASRRPCFRSVPAYANFLLLLAAFHMAPISPETRSADRLNGKPQIYSRSQNLGRSLYFWKTVQER